MSAAGGIKVTTFVIATIAIFNTIRKEKTTLYLIEKYQKDTVVFRNYSHFYCIYRYGYVYTYHNQFQYTFNQNNTFEVVSAFGTVGLTMDLTSEYYN